jgi:hypothetical protein
VPALRNSTVEACCAIVCSEHMIPRMTYCYTVRAQVMSDDDERPFSAASVEARCRVMKTYYETQQYVRCRKWCFQRVSSEHL